MADWCLVSFCKTRIIFSGINGIFFLGKCCLHVSANKTTEPIVIFTKKTLSICKEKYEIRSNAIRKSKFDGIVLPQNADGIAGYHKTCYKYYIAIKPYTATHKKGNTFLSELA